MVKNNLKAHTIIKNANIITIDPSQPRAQSLAILNGLLVSIGDNYSSESLIGPNTEVLDLSGKTVYEG